MISEPFRVIGMKLLSLLVRDFLPRRRFPGEIRSDVILLPVVIVVVGGTVTLAGGPMASTLRLLLAVLVVLAVVPCCGALERSTRAGVGTLRSFQP